MYAGIDFGTSSSSIGVWEGQAPLLIPLEKESTRLPSVLYTSRSNVKIEEIDLSELKKRVSIAKRMQTIEYNKAKRKGGSIKEITDSELENIERGLMRRELAGLAKRKYEGQMISEALYADSDIVFGEQAILRHIQEPQSGYFIKSPKSFLGADIRKHHIDLFSEIITRILAFIKSKAEKYKHEEIDNIVLGRPVNFHGTRGGGEGNSQAIGVLEQAAIAAGFSNVEFLMEPIAAALDFERSISQDLVALILDAGGGTTDCSIVKLGPSYRQLNDRNGTVLGYAGERIGGTDLDIKLAMRKIMPHFGMNTFLNSGHPIPNTVFWNAISINDVNAQTQFMSKQTKREIEIYLAKAKDKKKVNRLKRLHEGGLSIRLNRSAELAKIHLSDSDPINLPLRYIESEFVISISRNDLRDAVERELDVFIKLMKEVEMQANVRPDIVYVTGGTMKSPVVEERIRSLYGNTEIVVGDLFGSVASGLTTWAQRIYQ